MATSAPSSRTSTVDNAFLTGINTAVGQHASAPTAFDLNGNTSVLSGMVNGLVDFGGNGGVGAYAGGGFGRARVKQLGDSDNAWAWQLLAGVYMPISDNVDVGLKYRYFRTGKLNFNDEFAFSPVGTTCGALACSGGTAFFNSGGHFSSHSLLASLTYNFGAASGRRRRRSRPRLRRRRQRPRRPRPARTVRSFSRPAACPVPPPPPPPPPAPVERGERGQ